MKIAGLIGASYRAASRALVLGTSPAALARARERVFVKSLARHLLAECRGGELRVFHRHGRGNQSDFGAEQLLHAISLCRVEQARGDQGQTAEFRYIAGCLWQIEVDFSGDWRAAVHAISRLTTGAADCKALVAAHPEPSDSSWRDALKAAAMACPGDFHLALLPPPADWEAGDDAPACWRLEGAEWRTAD